MDLLSKRAVEAKREHPGVGNTTLSLPRSRSGRGNLGERARVKEVVAVANRKTKAPNRLRTRKTRVTFASCLPVPSNFLDQL